MGTWIKSIPPKMLHDKLGVYRGQWLPEMDRSWVRKEDGTSVCSRMIRTPWGNVEHVTITRGDSGLHMAALSVRFCAAQWPDCSISGRPVKKALCRERLFT